ncbi:hypothetical protein [Jiulongibacter sp. NS-SX5]|uniref:hypothetical protein n=1 Tax=Jiulongibacter sp. NS-SX5 TaxID=3463854 RepID=UPI004058601A
MVELNEKGLKFKEVGIGEIYSGPNPSPSFKKFEYDSENRLIETLSSYNDADYYTTLTLKYHSNGNLQERITYDRNSNIIWQETYDIDGRPLQINDKFYTYQQNEICF